MYTTPSRTQKPPISGVISPALANLTHLMALDLGGNKLTGTIPPELADLNALRTINLAHNELQGKLPEWLGDKPMLEHALLDGNMLSGRCMVVAGWNCVQSCSAGWRDHGKTVLTVMMLAVMVLAVMVLTTRCLSNCMHTHTLCMCPGPIPVEWCTNSTHNPLFRIDNNIGVCGAVPTCLQSALTSINGTSLMGVVNSTNQSTVAKCCYVKQPQCSADEVREACGFDMY